MKDSRKVAEQSQKRRTDKATYSPPRLIEFGPVGTLTQSGTGIGSENQVGPPQNRMCTGSPNRSMC